MLTNFNDVVQELKKRNALEKPESPEIIEEFDLSIEKLPKLEEPPKNFLDELSQRCNLVLEAKEIKLVKRKLIEENGDIYYSISKTDNEWTIELYNSDSYVGELKDGEYCGQGKLISEGNIYEGTFKNNKLNGQGQVTLENGFIQKGTFVNNILNGQGEVIYSSDNVMSGEYKDGQLNGKGKWVHKKTTYIGVFENDKLIEGTITYSNGTIQEGKFKDNVLVASSIIKFKSGNQVIGSFKDLKKESFVTKNWILEEWAPQEVLYWISCHCKKYYQYVREQFNKNKIDGELFKILSEKDYDSLDVKRFHLRHILAVRDNFFKSWW